MVGFLDKASVIIFPICRFLFTEFGKDIHYCITINEQDHVTKIPERLGLTKGDFGDHIQDCYQANHYMSIASAKAIELCHQMLPKAQIGIALSYQPYYAATSHIQDILAAENVDLLTQRYILDLECKGIYSKEFKDYLKKHNVNLETKPTDFETLQKNSPDFVGINYYSSNIVKYLPATDNTRTIEGYPVP